MFVHLGPASCQPASTPLFERAQHSFVNSGPQFLTLATVGHSRKCPMRCCSNRSVETLRKVARRYTELRSCSPLPPSAEVEQEDLDGSPKRGFELDPAHESALLSGAESTFESEAVQDGEWRSLGRDTGLQSLSTSSRSEPANCHSTELSRPGAKPETFQSVAMPLDVNTRVASASNLDALEVASDGYGSPPSQGIEAVEDKQILSAEDSTLYISEEFPAPKMIKKASWGLRSPSHVNARSNRSSRASSVNSGEEDEPPTLHEDVEYYVPKVGDEVIGVVVSGNEYKLDVDIGSQKLGIMLMKDVYPLDIFGSDELFCDLAEVACSPSVPPVGQVRVVTDVDALNNVPSTVPLVDVGSVLSLRVQGVTFSGRPLLSARKVANRIAWQRVRQIHQKGEPFEVQCLEWNSHGLSCRIEGLRAFLPINQFLNRPSVSKPIQDLVGERTYVLITEVDEATRKLTVSEKRAWAWRNLQPGSLVHATVEKIFPFGVEVNLTGTVFRAMLHISSISCDFIVDIKKVFLVGEKLKAMVIKSPVPYRIALSTANLESSAGLILRDKERVFTEAEEIVALRQKNLHKSENNEAEDKVGSDIELEDPKIANWDWLDFGQEKKISTVDFSDNQQ